MELKSSKDVGETNQVPMAIKKLGIWSQTGFTMVSSQIPSRMPWDFLIPQTNPSTTKPHHNPTNNYPLLVRWESCYLNQRQPRNQKPGKEPKQGLPLQP